MVKNNSEAQDLTQESFLLLFRKIRTFRGDSKCSTWLHRLTINLVLMGLREKRHPEVSLDGELEPARKTPGTSWNLADLTFASAEWWTTSI
jgi:RNA polymerase sigma-70 factor (ECF subfamily)